MTTHLQKLVKYLSESDYQPVKGYNIINPPTHCTHETADCDCQEIENIEKQTGEHVTSSGAQDWMTPDEGHASKFGLKKPGLQPYTSLVRRVGKVPYFATRWRKTEVKGVAAEVKILPVESFAGDLSQIYDSWKLYVDEREETKDLLLPLLCLQEFIEEGRKGILAQLGNRIIGLVPIMVDELGEARISILTASPKEIEDGKEEYVEDALREGLDTYASSREWNLLTSDEGDNGDIVKQQLLKKAYRNKTYSIEKAGFETPGKANKMAFKQQRAAEEKALGHVPKTGNWLAPGRNGWINPEEMAELQGWDMESEKGQAEMAELQAYGTKEGKGGAQASFDPEDRRRGSGEGIKAKRGSSIKKYDESILRELDVKEDGTPDIDDTFTLADGSLASQRLEGWTDVVINKDPNAYHQAFGINPQGTRRSLTRQGVTQENAQMKFHRGNKFSVAMPAITDKIREGIAAGDENAEALLFLSVTGMRLGDESDHIGTKVKNPVTGEIEIKHTYGGSTILGKHLAIGGKNNDEIHIFAPLKTTNRHRYEGESVTILTPIKNKELADMLLRKGVGEISKTKDGRMVPKKIGKNSAGVGITSKAIFKKATADSIGHYMEQWVVGEGGLNLPKDADGKGFSPKDFRTNASRVTMGASVDKLINEKGLPKTKEQYNSFLDTVYKDVGAMLGDTPRVAKDSYIDPDLLDALLPEPADLPSEMFLDEPSEMTFDDWDEDRAENDEEYGVSRF